MTLHPTATPSPTDVERGPRVVVGVDGSAVAAHALDQARAEAELMGARLDVVWGWEPSDVPHAFRSVPHRWANGHASAWAAPALGGSTETSVHALCGPAGPAILEAGRGADLLVVGARARPVPSEPALGSVTRHVVVHATVPVMVVRGGEEATPVDLGGPIVVGIDGSVSSRHALVWALGEAARRGAGVIAVHGWGLMAPVTGPVPTHLDRVDLVRSGSERLVQQELDRVTGVEARTPRSGRSVDRRGAAAVLDAVAGGSARLVVVGRRGVGGLDWIAHRALGMVSHRVVTASPVPVVVVP